MSKRPADGRGMVASESPAAAAAGKKRKNKNKAPAAAKLAETAAGEAPPLSFTCRQETVPCTKKQYSGIRQCLAPPTYTFMNNS